MLYQFDLGFDLESCITNGDSGGIATPIFSGNDLVVDWEFEWVSLEPFNSAITHDVKLQSVPFLIY